MIKASYLALGMFVASAAFGGQKVSIRRQLDEQYRPLHAAFKARDLDKFSSFFAPDYRGKGPDGKPVSREQVIGDFGDRMKALSDPKWTTVIHRLTLKGDKADAVISGHLEASSPGQDGKPHRLILDASSLDHWRRSQSGWKLIGSEAKNVSISIDGKAMDSSHR